MITCLASAWPELINQCLKMPALKKHFNKEAVLLIERHLMDETSGGCFGMTSKERIDLLMNLIESVYTLDSFRSVIDYREELISEVIKEIEELEKAIKELEAEHKYLEIESYQKNYKKALQLSEFSSLWINGAMRVGCDLKRDEYYLFANELEKLFVEI